MSGPSFSIIKYIVHDTEENLKENMAVGNPGKEDWPFFPPGLFTAMVNGVCDHSESIENTMDNQCSRQ